MDVCSNFHDCRNCWCSHDCLGTLPLNPNKLELRFHNPKYESCRVIMSFPHILVVWSSGPVPVVQFLWSSSCGPVPCFRTPAKILIWDSLCLTICPLYWWEGKGQECEPCGHFVSRECLDWYVPQTTINVYVMRKPWIQTTTIHGLPCANRGSTLCATIHGLSAQLWIHALCNMELGATNYRDRAQSQRGTAIGYTRQC